MDAFVVVATVAAVVAGAIASISGFGIGSVLTPVLATQFDVRLAIAMVSLPHLAGTFVRFLLVRTRIDTDVLLGFGAPSAIGGLVGNQGGIRAAALLGVDVEREAFVATATAVALVLDGARIPVYLATQGTSLAPHWPLIALVAVGAVVGTLLGGWTLRRMSDAAFRRVVGVLLLVLGAYTLARAFP